MFAIMVLATPARAGEPVHPELLTGDPVRPLPLVTAGTRTFYAHGADVLEWNGTAIVDRIRLSARIAAIAARDEKTLLVTLAPKSDFGFASDRVEVLVPIGGPRPGRGLWSGGGVDAYLTLREARAVASGFEPENKELDEKKRAELLAALSAREAIDRTNAFLPFFRGQILLRAGRRDDALRAFDAAVNREHAPFNDLLRLSQMLEDEDEPAPAQRAFERGMTGLQAAGLRPDRLQSQVAYQVLMGVPRFALANALAKGDAARVDAIEERVALAFPRLEGAQLAWRDLAVWMRERGREDLAAKWSSRAELASASVSNLATPALLDRLLPTILGMSVIAPLVAFVVGLRRGARRSDSTRRVALDIVSAVAPLVAIVGLIAWSNARLEVIARRAYVPIALLDDGVASPDVARFVEQRLAPSAERDRLLQWANDEARATREGSRFEGRAPDDGAIRAAFERANVRAAIRDALGQRSPLTTSQRALGFQHTILLTGLLLIGGYFLGGRTPRAAAAASRVVPGGPESLPILGPVLGGAFLGALLALTVGEQLFASIAAPNNARFFGFESIARAPAIAPDRTWAIAILVAYALVHVVGVRLDRARE